MPFRFNPTTSQLDLVNNDTGIQGPLVSTDTAIVRWDGTTGNLVQDSLTILQDGGAIEAQMYITRRSVTELVQIHTDQSAIAPSLEIELTGSIEIELDAELIII